MKLKENIKFYRKKKGYTQIDLAKKLHVKQYNISDYEIGRVEPSISTLIKMAEVFDITLDTLVGKKQKDNIYEKNITDYSELNDKYLTTIADLTKNLPESEKWKLVDLIKVYVKK